MATAPADEVWNSPSVAPTERGCVDAGTLCRENILIEAFS